MNLLGNNIDHICIYCGEMEYRRLYSAYVIIAGKLCRITPKGYKKENI